MFNTFSNSWELVKASVRVLREDRELMIFPVISTIGVFIVTLIFFVPLLLTGILSSATEGSSFSGFQNALVWVVLFLFYIVMYTVIIYSNVALVGAAMIRLRGGNPTVGDGFRIAGERTGAIISYAVISATVGIVLSLLRDQDNIIGRIFASIINVAWNVVTFLVIPVLVVENLGPIDAVKRSGTLLRKTWGEQVVANGGIGIVFFLLMVAAVLVIGGPLFVIAMSINSVVLMVTAVTLSVLAVSILGLISSALNSVFQAALYMYATEHDISDTFRPDL